MTGQGSEAATLTGRCPHAHNIASLKHHTGLRKQRKDVSITRFSPSVTDTHAATDVHFSASVAAAASARAPLRPSAAKTRLLWTPASLRAWRREP